MARHVCIKSLILIFTWFVCFSSQHECDRVCLGDGGRICKYDFIIGIDYRNEKLMINGGPGPPIIVCQNDTVVADVRNLLPSGIETSIHWHGIPQTETPFMDGVSMVTQCPILPKTSFRYYFKVGRAGTYYYHAHSVFQQLDGLFGALIVREFGKEANDEIFIFSPQLKRLQTLQNDVESNVEVADINIQQFGSPELKNHHGHSAKRIRLINAAAMDCPLNIFVNFVPFQLVSVDGTNIKPIDVTSVLLHPGERIDVTMKPDVLKITRIIGYNLCKGYEKYGLSPDAIGESHNGENGQLPSYSDFLKAIKPITNHGLLPEADEVIYVRIDETDFNALNNTVDFRYKLGEVTTNTPSYLNDRRRNFRVPQVNNKSFVYPSSPILTQMEDVLEGVICSPETNSSDCENYLNDFCECLQIVDVPYKKSVDLFLINEGKTGNHSYVFHIHGYSFHILAMVSFKEAISVDDIKIKDSSREIFRNLVDPVEKDTVVVPNKGYVILRLFTDNPGYWLVESVPSKTRYGSGLEFLLKVDPSGIVIPENFPKCGTVRSPDQIFGDVL